MSRIFIIGHTWPEPQATAAGVRMMQLIHYFQKKGDTILFGSAASNAKAKSMLKKDKIETCDLKLNDESFDEMLLKFEPEMVIFDRFLTEEQFGWRVDKLVPAALKILDTEDLHFLRKARHLALKTGKLTEDILFELELTKREIAAIYRCDISLIISEIEIEILKKQFRISEEILLYLPFMLDTSSHNWQNLPEYKTRKDFMCIGNYLHEPNWDQLLFLKENIWPLIRRKLPDAQLHIYGSYAADKVYNLNKPSAGFLVKGFVENASEAFQKHRVSLAPLRFGAGLKGKVVESMRNGTPVVTTTFGAEGISTNEIGGFIAGSPEEISNRAVQLYTDEMLWYEKQKVGFELLEMKFDLQQHTKRLSEKISAVSENLNFHRRMNFTGEMMKQHLLKSHHYLSRFIMEKNKKTAESN